MIDHQFGSMSAAFLFLNAAEKGLLAAYREEALGLPLSYEHPRVVVQHGQCQKWGAYLQAGAAYVCDPTDEHIMYAGQRFGRYLLKEREGLGEVIADNLIAVGVVILDSNRGLRQAEQALFEVAVHEAWLTLHLDWDVIEEFLVLTRQRHMCQKASDCYLDGSTRPIQWMRSLQRKSFNE